MSAYPRSEISSQILNELEEFRKIIISKCSFNNKDLSI